jgi:hypothetical protein
MVGTPPPLTLEGVRIMNALRLRIALGAVAAVVVAGGAYAVASADQPDNAPAPPAAETPQLPDTETPDLGGDTGSDDGELACSGARVPVADVVPPGVPAATAERMAAIIAAAQGCDYAELAALAFEEGGRFTATFGDDFGDEASLAAYWQALEEAGEPVTEILVKLMTLPTHVSVATRSDGTDVAIHVAPRLMGEGPTAENRSELDDLFGEDQVDAWMADGMYLGWRVGITADGEWMFFVIGD